MHAHKSSFSTGTVSETVSESAEIVVQSSGQLGQILIDMPIKPAILLALIRLVQCKSDNWLHFQLPVLQFVKGQGVRNGHQNGHRILDSFTIRRNGL
jgi:hypothetical protein